MKIFIYIILISHLFSTQIIEPNPKGRKTIFIYHSGKTLVHENRNLEIEKSGDLYIKIVGIPSEIINTGIQIQANNFGKNRTTIIT